MMQYGPISAVLEQLAVSRIELRVQVVQVKAQVVARTVLREHTALAIQNFPAHCRNSHGAIGLRFQMALIFAGGNHLHPPQTGKQNAQTAREHHRHQAKLRVVLF